MNTIELQEGTQELIDNRTAFDQEYFQMLPRQNNPLRRNGITYIMSGDNDSLIIELSGDGTSTIQGIFTNLEQLKSFVVKNFEVFRKLIQGNVDEYVSLEDGVLDGFIHRDIPNDECSRNEKFHFFLNTVCQLYYGRHDGVSNKFRNYTSTKVRYTIEALEERYIPEEYQDRFKEATNFYRTNLNAKKCLGRLFRDIEDKEALIVFLEENSGHVSICHSIERGVSVNFFCTVISGLTETGRKYFKQVTYSGGEDSLFEVLAQLNPELVGKICNSVEKILYNTHRNPLKILLNAGFDNDAIVAFINSGTAEEVIHLLEDDIFMRIIKLENYKKHLEVIFGSITITDFIKVKNILLFAISNVSNPNGNGGANLIPDNVQILLERIKEFEEFEEYDHEETGRILILWSYDPDNITSENIRAHLIERAAEKASSIDAEITRQEGLKKEQTDTIARLSGK